MSSQNGFNTSLPIRTSRSMDEFSQYTASIAESLRSTLSLPLSLGRSTKITVSWKIFSFFLGIYEMTLQIHHGHFLESCVFWAWTLACQELATQNHKSSEIMPRYRMECGTFGACVEIPTLWTVGLPWCHDLRIVELDCEVWCWKKSKSFGLKMICLLSTGACIHYSIYMTMHYAQKTPSLKQKIITWTSGLGDINFSSLLTW